MFQTKEVCECMHVINEGIASSPAGPFLCSFTMLHTINNLLKVGDGPGDEAMKGCVGSSFNDHQNPRILTL